MEVIRLRGREWFLLLSILSAVGAFFFKEAQYAERESVRRQSQAAIAQIREIRALKKLWENKQLSGELKRLRKALPSERIKRFEIGHKKAVMELTGLEGRELNRILGRLGALPLRLVGMTVEREAGKYRMGCRCKW